MADNNNPRTTAAREAMMAEIVVKELEQFKDSHNHILQAVDKLLLQYNGVNELINVMNRRDESLAKVLKAVLLTQERYASLLDMSMTVANELKDINEQGIGIEPDSLDKVIKAVLEANRPIREHIRWLTYGVCAAFLILLLTVILL